MIPQELIDIIGTPQTGKPYTDTATKFPGTALAVAEHLQGCWTIWLEGIFSVALGSIPMEHFSILRDGLCPEFRAPARSKYLGTTVTHSITQQTGVVVAVSYYRSGTIQLHVQPAASDVKDAITAKQFAADVQFFDSTVKPAGAPGCMFGNLDLLEMQEPR